MASEHEILKTNDRRVYVQAEFPPIPTNEYDYSASYDEHRDESSIIGWGATPEAAIADLKERTEES
jgi:hypothetical protein